MIRLRDIVKLYPMGKRELEVLRGISLDIGKGGMVAIMGAGEKIISILTSLHSEQGITLIVITHESNIAHQCQRIIHLKDGQVIAK